MGKTSKGRVHQGKSSYPYRTSRVGQHVHIIRPKMRRQGAQPFYIGLFAARQQGPYPTGPKLRKQPELKRLSFVRAYSVFLSAKLATLYDSSKGTLPNSLQPRLRALETRVAVVGSPLWTRLHITSDRVLWQLDSKVDVVCGVADSWLHSPAALTQHAEPGDKMDEMDAFRQRVLEACQAITASPPVHRMLEGMEPSRDYLAARYQAAHHAVVASQAYNNLLSTLRRLAGRMQDSTFASAVAQRLYSLVSPVADPTLERITALPVYKDLVQHLTPLEQPCSGEMHPAPSFALPSCAAC